MVKLFINDFNLIKDKENEQIKFIKKEKNKINSLKSLDLKDINVSQFQQFIENFFKTNIVKLRDLLGEKKLYEIKGNIFHCYNYMIILAKIYIFFFESFPII